MPVDCVDDWSQNVSLLANKLTYAWKAAHDTITARFTTTSQISFDWESAPGYLRIGPRSNDGIVTNIYQPGFSFHDMMHGKASSLSGPPLLVFKVAKGFEWHGGWHQSGNDYKWSFGRIDADVRPDDIMGPLILLDEAGRLEMQNVLELKEMHAQAYAAFLDACGGGLDVTVEESSETNKATYVNLRVATSGGSAFLIEARMTAACPDVAGIWRRLRGSRVAFLKELHALGQHNTISREEYALVCCVSVGSDLRIDHMGFELFLTDEHKAAKGKISDASAVKAASARREMKSREAQARREQRARDAIAEEAAREQCERERAARQAAAEAKRAVDAAELEEKRQAIAAEAAAKLAAARAKAETEAEAQRERASAAEAAMRAEQRAAFESRKMEQEAAARERESRHRQKQADEEAKSRAKYKEASEAKKAAKQEKKARRKAPSAFAVQEERERQAAAERQADEKKAVELAAEVERREQEAASTGNVH